MRCDVMDCVDFFNLDFWITYASSSDPTFRQMIDGVDRTVG